MSGLDSIRTYGEIAVVGVVLIVGAVVLTFFVLYFCVGLFEKRPIKRFVPVEWSQLPEPSKYFLAVNESAGKLGFDFVGALGQPRKSGIYKAYVSVWISPHRTTVLRVVGGKTAGVSEKKMLLTSYLADNRIIESSDLYGAADPSGLTDRQFLLHAGLDELYQFHRQRLAAQKLPAQFFEKSHVFEVLESLEAMRAARLEELGLARFTNAEKTIYSFTPKGAWRMCSALSSTKNEAMVQQERSALKRPGDA